jgi:ribonuclease E
MAERSPSSGLLSRHAERSAAPACAKALPDGSPDAPAPAAEAPDLRPADACPSATAAWGASDAALRVLRPGAADHPALADAAAEKLVVPAQDVPELDATCPEPKPQLVPWAQPAEAAELYTQVAAPSAARSCAATEAAAQLARADAARTPMPAQKLKLKIKMKPEAKPSRPKQEAQLASQAAQAESQPPEAQPPAARPKRASPAAAAQPALPAAQPLCSQIPQVQREPWPPEAPQPPACSQQEAQQSPLAVAPQAASSVPAAQTQPLSAA